MAWLRIDPRYGRWAGLDLPVHRNWLFWVGCVVSVGIGILAVMTGHLWAPVGAVVWIPITGYAVGIP